MTTLKSKAAQVKKNYEIKKPALEKDNFEIKINLKSDVLHVDLDTPAAVTAAVHLVFLKS